VILSGRTVFLDRDGTLNRKLPEGSYVTTRHLLKLLPGAAAAVRMLNSFGAVTIVVTNQRGIARGLMTEVDLADVHEELARQLGTLGAHVDAVYHCPHDLGECDCRKPGGAMLRRALAEVSAASQLGAILIGDSDSDVEAAHRAGVIAVAVGGQASSFKSRPELWAEDLLMAVRLIAGGRELSAHRPDIVDNRSPSHHAST
jgi:D-glycero-D-manno-heptose 1,7-bisphosphate phosphatase